MASIRRMEQAKALDAKSIPITGINEAQVLMDIDGYLRRTNRYFITLDLEFCTVFLG